MRPGQLRKSVGWNTADSYILLPFWQGAHSVVDNILHTINENNASAMKTVTFVMHAWI